MSLRLPDSAKRHSSADWIAASSRLVAWLSLDADDSDPIRFLTYVGAALQTVAPEIGESIVNLLESSQSPSIDSLLTALLNQIVAFPHDIMLVLDDYHRLDNAEIDAAVVFLIDNQPPQLHLVITTREDPHLPLARLRVNGELNEVRAADLRLNLDEATEFLNHAMGLSLSPDDISSLAARTEGWIAGLQLAAISLQQHTNTTDFIQSFSGSHQFVLDYLVEEVLSLQPKHIQNFLLKTSILNRMCAPLCDALLQNDEYLSQTLLSSIQQANLFLVPLDDERLWFRYHHLFADLLRKRLEQSASMEVNRLHIRASAWFEQHGQPSEAIYHALAAKDFERAAGMIELEWATSHTNNIQSLEQRTWMQALPTPVYRNRPVLSAGFGWVLLDFGELDLADARLRDAEQWLETAEQMKTSKAEMVVVDDDAFQRLPVIIASARTYHALALGDIPNTIRHGQQVLELAEEDDHYQHGVAMSLLGLAYWSTGKLEAAYQFMSEGMERMYKLGNVHFALSSIFGLADVLLGQGRLLDAIDIYEEGLKVAEAQPFMIQGIADLQMGLGDLYREQNDFETAREYLNQSEMLGQQAGLPDWRVRFCKVQARMKQTSRDIDEALDLLDEAERLYYSTPVPDVQPIAAAKARIWIQQGRINKALSWAQNRGLSLDSDVGYLNEFELMTLVRIHIARIENGYTESPINALTELLERLLDVAEVDKRMGSVIKISILQAHLQWILDIWDAALAKLRRALQLAEPEGYVRVFVDEGRVMKAMLLEAGARGLMPSYTSKLLAAFEADTDEKKAQSGLHHPDLFETLTSREQDVLKLIVAGYSNPDIAAELIIAVTTVKTHAKNIYGKLGVNNRSQAIARTKDLNLF